MTDETTAKLAAIKAKIGVRFGPTSANMVYEPSFSEAEVQTLLGMIDDLTRERESLGASCLAIIDALEWTGDGYSWNPSHGDYREHPDDAVRRAADAHRADVARLTAERDAAAAKERAEIVAWLRRQADSGEKYLDDNGRDRNMHPSTVSAISTMRTLAGSIELGIYKGGGDG